MRKQISLILALTLLLMLQFPALVIPGITAISEEVSLSQGNEGDVQSLGDIITFGKFEQDNYLSNGKEPIQWRVLARDGTRALLISLYNLDCQPYNEEYIPVTWEACTLREWLNSSFLSTAFTLTQQEAIMITSHNNDGNNENGTNGGSSEQDKVFLLSTTEVEQYFINDNDRVAQDTEYASTDNYSSKETTFPIYSEAGPWWLRSPDSRDVITSVSSGGNYRDSGFTVYMDIGVRPAIWIDLTSASDNMSINDEANPSKENEANTLRPGDTIIFGKYEQDNNIGNGKEPITWRVLAYDKGKTLLISLYNLDCQQYDTKWDLTFGSWETCTLRGWLNSSFLNSAFTHQEQKAILMTTLKNQQYTDFGKDGPSPIGNPTQDRVFLLSVDEAEHYFSGDDDRIAMNTDYAKTQNAYTFDNGAGPWWLRSPGNGYDYAAAVNGDGSISSAGAEVNNLISRCVVRPALMLDLSSGFKVNGDADSQLVTEKNDSSLETAEKEAEVNKRFDDFLNGIGEFSDGEIEKILFGDKNTLDLGFRDAYTNEHGLTFVYFQGVLLHHIHKGGDEILAIGIKNQMGERRVTILSWPVKDRISNSPKSEVFIGVTSADHSWSWNEYYHNEEDAGAALNRHIGTVLDFSMYASPKDLILKGANEVTSRFLDLFSEKSETNRAFLSGIWRPKERTLVYESKYILKMLSNETKLIEVIDYQTFMDSIGQRDALPFLSSFSYQGERKP